MFISTNPNPGGNKVGDCVIRAIAVATSKEWEEVYVALALKGLEMYDMPSSNAVWGSYLADNGFERISLPDTCPVCYTIRDFCNDYPNGAYILGTGTHAVAVVDGSYWDSWDSGDEVPVYYWHKKEEG